MSTSGCRRRGGRRKATLGVPPSRGTLGPRAVRDPEHARTHRAREPGDPAVLCGDERRRAHREVYGLTPMTDDRRKSDRLVVPTKPPNTAGQPATEAGEGSERAKGH